MPNRHSPGHRDANESQIIDVLDNYHIDYIKLHEGAGADLLVLLNPMELWEVKNNEQPPSKRVLTPLETYRQAYCGMKHIPYRVIETAEQAAEVLGNYLRGEK